MSQTFDAQVVLVSSCDLKYPIVWLSDGLTVWLPQLKRFRLELVLFQKLSGSMLHAHVHHLKQMLKAAILNEQKTWNKLNNIK